MANEHKKDFNRMLHDSKDMPKTKELTDEKALRNTAVIRFILPRHYLAQPISLNKMALTSLSP